MSMYKITFSIVSVLFFIVPLSAQQSDFYSSTGKIYGVYAVVMLLLLGLIIYLFSLDKKISKIEKDLDNE